MPQTIKFTRDDIQAETAPAGVVKFKLAEIDPPTPTAGESAYRQSREAPFDYLRTAATNVPASAGRAVMDIAKAVPSILASMPGVVAASTRGETPALDIAKAVIDRYASRFGSAEGRALAVRDDPVGVVGDLAAVVAPAKAATGALRVPMGEIAAANAARVRSVAKAIPAGAASVAGDIALDALPFGRTATRIVKGAKAAYEAGKPGAENPPQIRPVSAPAPPAAAPAPPKAIWTVGEPGAPEWLMKGAKAGERRILSPSSIHSELSLEARRAGRPKLTEVEMSAAADAVRAGASPAEVVRALPASKQAAQDAATKAFAARFNTPPAAVLDADIAARNAAYRARRGK